MIHGSLASVESDSWQSLLASSITDPRTLLERLNLDPALLGPAVLASADFALRVPEPYLARMPWTFAFNCQRRLRNQLPLLFPQALSLRG